MGSQRAAAMMAIKAVETYDSTFELPREVPSAYSSLENHRCLFMFCVDRSLGLTAMFLPPLLPYGYHPLVLSVCPPGCQRQSQLIVSCSPKNKIPPPSPK
ncbi:unnamed protein product [Discosporangium mesarthrocarpum]